MTAVTKGFLITTLTGPFIIAALFALPSVLARSAADDVSALEGRTLALVGAGDLLPPIRDELAPLGIAVEEAGEAEPLADRVRAGRLDGYVVFPADPLGEDHPRYFSDEAVDVALRALVDGVIGRAVVQGRLRRAGLDAERITRLTRQPRLQVAVSVAGMAVATVAAVWAAAKVFRLGILLTGTKGTLGQVARLLRA